jgi:protein-S-isoprenylcysteine O-methyltransferase Ste14
MLSFLMIRQLLMAALMVLCLGSFVWGMRAFFVQPAGYTAGMKFITISSAICAIIQLAAIISARDVPLKWTFVAAIAYLGSMALYWWTISVNRKTPLSAAFSPDLPTHLVQRGPYRVIRHPFYASYLLMWTAAVPASADWRVLITVAFMIAVYISAARAEERKFSNSALAGAYREYRSRTGLLVPNPLKLLSAGRTR